MRGLRPILIVFALALAVAGCGGDESAQPQEGTTPAEMTETKDADAMKKDAMKKDAMKKDAMKKDAASSRPAGEAGLRVAAKQAQIVAKSSLPRSSHWHPI